MSKSRSRWPVFSRSFAVPDATLTHIVFNAYNTQDQMPTIVKTTIQAGGLPGKHLSNGGLAAG